VVTKQERRLARTMANDTAKYEQRGINIAIKIGSRAMRKTLVAYKAKRKTKGIVKREFVNAVDELRDAMVVAHLLGIRAVREAALLQLSAYRGAVGVLRKRLTIPVDDLKKLQKNYKAQALIVLNNASAVAEAKLQRAILVSVQKGEHVKDAVKRLRVAFDKSGLSPSNSFQLEGIFRTQMLVAYSAARWQECQDPGIDEILWGYKYVTVGDDRVREEHAALDGTTLPKDDPIWDEIYTPNGWVCRCSIIAIFEEREIVRPPKIVEIDGKIIRPGADEGFNVNFGKIMMGEGVWI